MQFFETGPDIRRRVLQWFVQMPILLILASCGQKGESNMPTAETLPVTDYEVLLAQFEEELAAAQEAADVNPSDGTRFYAAQVRTNVGLCLDALARRDEAIAELVRAARELRVLPDTLDGKSDTLGACADGLGLAYHGAGEHELAEASFVEAIEHRVAANNGMATVSKIHLGNLYLSMSRYSQARSRLEEALAEASDPEVIVLCHSALGRYFHTVGSYAEALDQHVEAEIAARKLWGEDSGQVVGIHSDQASALFRSGRYVEARDRYMAVLDYYETLDDIAGIAAVLNNLANVDLQRGDPESAAAHFQRAIDLRVETGRTDDPEILTSLSGLGYLHLWNRNVEEAGLVFEEAEKRALDLLGENHPLTIEIRQGIGYIALALGNRIDALKRAEQAFSSGRQLMLEALKTGTEEQQIDYRKKIDLMSLTCAIGDPELIAERLLLAQGLVSGSKLDEVSGGSVPVGTATVAYIRFFEYDTSGEWTARYGAVVSEADKPSVWCRLATDEQLAALVDALFAHMAFEQAMGDGKKPPVPLRKLEPTLRRLHELIWKPVADRLSTDTDHLAVCPDGIVSAIPFAALMDGDQFLCEGPLSLSFFSLLRDAMIEPKAPEPGPSLAFGISVFGADLTDAMSSAIAVVFPITHPCPERDG
ncbi:MAG: tetratricopeptide repeat protein [Verrucomicrobiales bacterium]